MPKPPLHQLCSVPGFDGDGYRNSKCGSICPSFTTASPVLGLAEDAEGDPGCEIAPHCREEGGCHCRLCS
ncbi:hypothetical protein NL676_030970 [Syzygium grande]|nr:hypothetical protein NL676_030970 [Syzygium grande]